MRGYSLCLRRQARFHANEVSISSFASKRFHADLSAFHRSRCEPCPSSDLSINAQATFPRGGRLRFSLTRKMDFIFPFSKAKDIRGRFPSESHRTSRTKDSCTSRQTRQPFHPHPVRSHLNRYQLFQLYPPQNEPHQARSAGAQERGIFKGEICGV